MTKHFEQRGNIRGLVLIDLTKNILFSIIISFNLYERRPTFLFFLILPIIKCSFERRFYRSRQIFPSTHLFKFGKKKYSLETKPGEYGERGRNSWSKSLNFSIAVSYLYTLELSWWKSTLLLAKRSRFFLRMLLKRSNKLV